MEFAKIATNENIGCVVNGSGAPSLGCLAIIVQSVITLALGFLGLVTLVMLLIGALKFVTSMGDPKGLQSAQKTMTYAVIGAVVILMAFVLIGIFSTMLGLPNILTEFKLYQP